jgi:hypothetical protein
MDFLGFDDTWHPKSWNLMFPLKSMEYYNKQKEFPHFKSMVTGYDDENRSVSKRDQALSHP